MPGLKKNRMIKQLTCFLCLWVWLVSCEDSTPQAAYLVLNPSFKTTSGQGVPLHQFSEYHVYINQAYHGAFLPGVSIPVLADQPVEVQVLPGVRDNGVSSTPNTYLLVTPWSVNQNLPVGEKTTLSPVFSYKPTARIRWVEDFEGVDHTLALDLDQDPLTFCRQSVEEDTLSGHFGEIVLTAQHPYLLVGQILPMQGVPTDGRPVYLELHYQNDIEFKLGLQGSTGGANPAQLIKVGLRPQAAWNKIYVNFTPDVQASDLPSYQVILEAQLPEGMMQGKVSLDNLRFIHL